MPLLTLQTNQRFTDSLRDELLTELCNLVARELSKPKAYIQIVLLPDAVMSFAGSSEPTAFVELKSLALPDDKPKPLSAALCALLQKKLSISPDRVFLNFEAMPRTHWGWNGHTFE